MPFYCHNTIIQKHNNDSIDIFIDILWFYGANNYEVVKITGEWDFRLAGSVQWSSGILLHIADLEYRIWSFIHYEAFKTMKLLNSLMTHFSLF